jgi:hypothetical protein
MKWSFVASSPIKRGLYLKFCIVTKVLIIITQHLIKLSNGLVPTIMAKATKEQSPHFTTIIKTAK